MRVLLALLTALFCTSGAYAVEAQKTPKIHRYVAGHTAWNTNSYWIEGTNGIVLVDAQLLPSDAVRLSDQIKATGKPLLGALITHPHLDHFGGLPVLRDAFGEFPVFAAKATADHMSSVQKQMLGFYPMPNSWGEALDERLVAATNIVENGQMLEIGGIGFKVHDLGAGEAENNTLFEIPALNVVFSGDSVYPNAHFYVGDGHIDGVLAHLAYLEKTFDEDTFFFAGHSNPSRLSAVPAQETYIETLVLLTKAERRMASNIGENGYLTNEARARAVSAALAKFPGLDDYGFDPRQLIAFNIYGVETWLLSQPDES